MKIVTIKGLWLLHWCSKFHIDISSRLWVIGVSNIENRTHTHTSGRQLKIPFLDILNFSEYSDTNISIFFCSRKHSFLSEEGKVRSQLNESPRGYAFKNISFFVISSQLIFKHYSSFSLQIRKMHKFCHVNLFSTSLCLQVIIQRHKKPVIFVPQKWGYVINKYISVVSQDLFRNMLSYLRIFIGRLKFSSFFKKFFHNFLKIKV